MNAACTQTKTNFLSYLWCCII